MFRQILKGCFVAWGGFSLFVALALALLLVWLAIFGNRDKIDRASPKDAWFVLDWSGLGDRKVEKVLHSYVSSRSFCGDHLDAFEIKIDELSVEELEISSFGSGKRWTRCDKLSKPASDAVSFAGDWVKTSSEIPWFPKENELRSDEFYVVPWSVYYHDDLVTAAELIFACPKKRTLYFFGSKI